MPPNGDNDDSVASLGGFKRYSSNKKNETSSMEEVCVSELMKGSPFNLSKVHSRPVDKRDIEIEFKEPREEDSRRENADAMREGNDSAATGAGEDNIPASMVIESDLNVDDTLFDSPHNYAMTQIPTKSPEAQESNSPKLSPLLPVKRMPSVPTKAVDADATASVTSMKSQTSLRSKASSSKTNGISAYKKDSTASQNSHNEKNNQGGKFPAASSDSQELSALQRSRSGALFGSSEHELDKADSIEPGDFGVIWVRTHSSKGGSVFFGKSRSRTISGVQSIDENKELTFSPSMMSEESEDSQERHANFKSSPQQSHKSITFAPDKKPWRPASGSSILSGDSQERYAKARSIFLQSHAEKQLMRSGDSVSMNSRGSKEQYAKSRSPSLLSKKSIQFDADRDLLNPVEGLSMLTGDSQEKYAKARSRSNLSQQDIELMMQVDGISMLSGDSQEKYAKARSRSNLSQDSILVGDQELLKPKENLSFMSADSQELYALRAMRTMHKSDKPNMVMPTCERPPRPPTSSPVVTRVNGNLPRMLTKDDNATIRSHNENGTFASEGKSTGTFGLSTVGSTNEDEETLLTYDKSIAPSKGKNIFSQLYDGARANLDREESGSESEDSDVEDVDGTIAEPLEKDNSGESENSDEDDITEKTPERDNSGDSENSDEDVGDLDDDEDEDDDETIEDEGTYFNVSSVKGDAKSTKSNVSDVSGSFDDDEVLGQMTTINKDSEKGPANLEDAQKILKEEKMVKKKQKKKIFKFATGLGKNKVARKTVEAPTQARNKEKKTTKKKMTNVRNMKQTAIRAPKKKKATKKTKAQLRTICINGHTDQDDIVPRKGEPGAKVMRVCKLTSHGYVAAEFSSVDPNNTPLHVACLTHYPTRFILDHLLKSDTNMAIATENSSGELPIHYAVMDKKGVDPEVFDALIKKFPESVEHRNIDESLPIHVACQVGAPSLYSIKKLVEINPSAVMLQNDLQVPVDDDRVEKENENQGFFRKMFCMEWFQEEGPKYVGYETGWTPLHLAVVNGAPPEVIETLIEANPECMNVKTNKKRTAYECAVGVIINAILNDVPMYKVQNTYNAIEIMQSFGKEFVKKDELALKAGIINSALENTDSYGELWMTIAEKLPAGEKIEQMLSGKKNEEAVKDDDDDEDEADWQNEKGMTDLHRAVLKRVDPEEIQELLEQSPECMDIVSTADRTPFECAKELLIRGLLKKTPMNRLTNTFVTLEAMQAYRESQGEEVPDDFDATMALSKADVSHYESPPKPVFGSRSDNYQYMKDFVEMNLKGRSLLGAMVTADNDSAVQPYEYYPPANLAHVNLRVNVPAGYRRLRRAFLGARSEFLNTTVYRDRLKYRKMNAIPWNKCAKAIGKPKLEKGEKWSQFIGAVRTMQYICPGSDEVGPAHVAYERMELIEYNDFCFAVKSTVKTPDLPYGSEYETAFQILFIDKGINNCRLICSSEVIVTGMALDDDWQVRNAMRHRATDYFFAVADAICMHSGEADVEDV